MSGGQDHVVFGDQLQTLHGLIGNLSIAVERRHRGPRYACGGDLALNLRPEGEFFSAAVEPPGRFIRGVYSRHPDDLIARTSGDLDSHRVKSADAVIERYGPVSFNPRDRLS